MNYLIIYLLIINALGLLLMLADKRKAQKKLWRIPETTLLVVGFLGGSFGCILGMQLFRHKTRKPKFMIGLPLLLAVNMIAVVCLCKILS